MKKLLLPLLALTALTAACGDDASKTTVDVTASVVADSTPADTTGETTAPEPGDVIDPATVRVYTPAEVCTLVSQEIATATLGTEITEVAPFDLSTPQCSYSFIAADGVSSNLTLAVQRPIEDLGGAAGQAGFDFTTSFVLFDTEYEAIAGLGDAAAVSAAPTFTQIAVLANNQVFTIVTSAAIDVANLVAFGQEAAANV